MALDEVSAIKTLVGGARVPHASRTIKTDTKVGNYFLTCDDQGQKITGRVVSTGNGGELVNGRSWVAGEQSTRLHGRDRIAVVTEGGR